jgi:lipopolysaccharide transport system permease protein
MSNTVTTPDDYILVIEPGRRRLGDDLRELLHYRDLLYFLVKRDLTVRYKQTFLGVSWAVLQPFLTMVVFSVFLGSIVGVPSGDMPYPVFAYLGLLPWTYFSGSVSRCASGLVANANLLTKVYFPRILIPASATISALVDFLVAGIVLLGIMLWYGLWPSPLMVLFIPLTAVTALLALGVGMWLAALNVKYRDVQQATPFVMQLWLFATPVVYPENVAPENYRFLFDLNPMAGVITAYRGSALGESIPWGSIGLALVLSVVLFAVGIRRFRKMERYFADVV